jgi:NADH-quinone oxidoreductase subunit L
MENAVYFIPAFPLVGFAIIVFLGKKLGDPKAGYIGTLAVFGSFIATLVTWLDLRTHDPRLQTNHHYDIFTWMNVGGLDVHASLLVDPLSMTMALFVTGISTLIHLYSVGYMKGDSRFHQFFVYLNLFVFSMIMLVLGDNFLMLFLGWEGVGACSYYLVGFWFERNTAATAAKKAFIVNRIGDVGLLLAIFVMYHSTGTLNFMTQDGNGVLDQLSAVPEGTVTAMALLLFVGAIGKSAQLPLYVWLPDAMEGPTPVSALIHAATMVTAGVYLMARVSPMLEISHTAALTVAIVGAASALFAATVACAQNDIKRVLAYSTMSQLGYMFLAIGAGMASAGVFHMITHAFFKALLFLSAGAVIHALHEEQNLKNMGNLRKYIPVTFGVFLIGWLAIAGIPPFAGFWSKDEILLNAFEFNKALYGIALATVLLTAYYMSRLFFLAFYGKDRWKDKPEPKAEMELATADSGHDDHHGKAQTPHESPWVMLFPMVVLAILSVLGGLLQVNFGGDHLANRLDNFLNPLLGPYQTEHVVTSSTKWILALISVGVALLGIIIAAVVARASALWPKSLEPGVLKRAWFVDTIYEWIFARPGGALAAFFSNVVDRLFVDGIVNGSARVVGYTAAGLRRAQSGYVRGYVVTIVGGTILVLVYALVRSNG